MGVESEIELDDAAARQALERFVVDNDDLLELEERIGRFNIFDALGIARAEIRHSNFLAWLLDPAESHGQGSLFLKAILMDLLKQAPTDMRPFSPIELDGEELRGVEIRREWRNIDLLIRCEQPPFVIAIENKIGAGEHGHQLQRYEDTVRSEFGQVRCMFVFLSTDGDDASDEDWVPYSYGAIHSALQRIVRSNRGAIGGEVASFLDHYLRLIGERFMPDTELDALCERIYKNHRQAIDLIWERVDKSQYGFLDVMQSLVQRRPDLWIPHARRKSVYSFGSQWLMERTAAAGCWRDRDDRDWLVFGFESAPGWCGLAPYIGPFRDNALRILVTKRLTEDANEFGFKLTPRSAQRLSQGSLPEWIGLGTRKVMSWNAVEQPDVLRLEAAADEALERLHRHLQQIPDALRPIFDDWKRSQPAAAAAQR